MHAQYACTPRTRTLRSRSGFTLIELMVVILIIAILAGLLLVAVWGAMGTAKDAQTILEIDQMAQALEAYKSKYGEYPPIGGNLARIQSHLARAYPKYIPDMTTLNTLNTLSPDQALVFWLGGMPVAAGGGGSVEGFSANVAMPFVSTNIGSWSARTASTLGVAEPTQRTQPFFNFDPRRLRTPSASSTSNFFWVYVPHGKNSPYMYIPADQYVVSGPAVYQFNHPNGIVVPYRADTTSALTLPTAFVNAKTYQIIAAGDDDMYGTNQNRAYPNGDGYSQEDEDNLTNFAGRRLSRARPN